LVGDGKNIKPVLRTIYTCNPDYEFPIHKYSTYNSKYPAVSDCDIQTGLYRSCTSLISKHSKDFIDTVQENQIINCKLKQRTSSTTNMQHLANEKKQNQRSKKIFDEIKKMRPSKSETFTYVTFSNDNKTTNTLSPSSSSLTPTEKESKKTTKTKIVCYVDSKIGSFENIKHTPGGGKKKILHQELNLDHVTSKCHSKDNLKHNSGGGLVKIKSTKSDYSNIQSKVESRANTNHSPGGGKVKIINKKLDFSNVTSKCGSLSNSNHRPGGGNVKIFDQPTIYKTRKKKNLDSKQQFFQ